MSPADGKLLWKRTAGGYTRFSVGADFLVMRGYGGHGVKVRLDDGKDYPKAANSAARRTPAVRWH